MEYEKYVFKCSGEKCNMEDKKGMKPCTISFEFEVGVCVPPPDCPYGGIFTQKD